MRRVFLLHIVTGILFIGFLKPTFGQEELIFGKYRHKTEIGSANIQYRFYTEYKLELRVDSQYVLQTFSYHTSKPGLKSGFELVESNKQRGYWKVERNLLLLRRISLTIEFNENNLDTPNWVELEVKGWKKKKGYFTLRKKPKG